MDLFESLLLFNDMIDKLNPYKKLNKKVYKDLPILYHINYSIDGKN